MLSFSPPQQVQLFIPQKGIDVIVELSGFHTGSEISSPKELNSLIPRYLLCHHYVAIHQIRWRTDEHLSIKRHGPPQIRGNWGGKGAFRVTVLVSILSVFFLYIERAVVHYCHHSASLFFFFLFPFALLPKTGGGVCTRQAEKKGGVQSKALHIFGYLGIFSDAFLVFLLLFRSN